MANKFLNVNRGGTADIAAITAEVSRKIEATNAIALDSKVDKLQSAAGNVLLESIADGSYKETTKNILTRDETDDLVTAAKTEMTSKIAESETRQETRTYAKVDVDNKLRGKLDVVGGPKEAGLIPMQSDKHNGLVLSQYKFSDLIGKKISGYSRAGKVLISGATEDEIIESTITASTLKKTYYRYTQYSAKAASDNGPFRAMSAINYVAAADITINHVTLNGDLPLQFAYTQDGQTRDVTRVKVMKNNQQEAVSIIPTGKKTAVWSPNTRINKEETWNIKIPNINTVVLIEVWYTFL